MGEELFKGIEDGITQTLVFLLAQMYVVDADEIFRRLCEGFPYGIDCCCSHRNVFLRQLLINDASVQIHVVEVEVLVEVVLISRARKRSQYFWFYLVVQLLAQAF